MTRVTGTNANMFVKLMWVRRRDKETGEMFIDRFYFTIPYEFGKRLLENGMILFKIEEKEGKIVLTPAHS